jgi:hypothetical protein
MTSNDHTRRQSSLANKALQGLQDNPMRLPLALLALLLLPPLSQAHAQSWDAKALGRKPEAPAPKPKDRAGGMKACPEYGAGFYRLAGSDTCVRIGGGVSTDVGTSGVLR